MQVKMINATKKNEKKYAKIKLTKNLNSSLMTMLYVRILFLKYRISIESMKHQII